MLLFKYSLSLSKCNTFPLRKLPQRYAYPPIISASSLKSTWVRLVCPISKNSAWILPTPCYKTPTSPLRKSPKNADIPTFPISSATSETLTECRRESIVTQEKRKTSLAHGNSFPKRSKKQKKHSITKRWLQRGGCLFYHHLYTWSTMPAL